MGSASQRAGKNIYSSISVGDGVWTGANSTILPGVSIGDEAIIAAGAVVCKNVPTNELCGGVPAHFIKMLN